MALVKCQECGKQISNSAKSCPNCGAKTKTSKRRSISNKCKLFLLVILIFVWVGVSKSIKRQSPDYSVSADQLYNEYKSNEVAADSKYKGKIVVVSGVIQDIGKDIIAQPYIVIGGIGFLDGVQCMFTESENASVARLYKGQSVKVKGEVVGKMGNVLLNRCSLQVVAKVTVDSDKGEYSDKGKRDEAISDLEAKKESMIYAKGKRDEAFSDLEEAISLLEEAYNNRGYAYDDAKGGHDEVISNLNKVLEINPTFAKAYFVRGKAYDAKGEHDQAILDYTKAIEIDPGFAKAYRSRGEAYFMKGEYDRAISNCAKAIEINPSFAGAYYTRGNAFGMKKQYDQAISDLSKAIEINPGFAKAYRSRGVCYFKKGEYDRAISNITKEIEINPRDAKAYCNRGYAYYKKGEFDKAWEDVHKAQSLGLQDFPEFLKDLREASRRKR